MHLYVVESLLETGVVRVGTIMIGARCIILLVYMSESSPSTFTIIRTKSNLEPLNYTCGLGNLPNGTVQEETTNIESYPWLGLLLYPVGSANPRRTTVVLITKQLAIATALDIDSYPKLDFRARSRVLFGRNYSGPFFRIKDYTFHPDFSTTTYSTIALVQLDEKDLKKLLPICPPPHDFEKIDQIYAMTVDHEVRNSFMVKVYKMEYVESTECIEFYNDTKLNIESMVPSHMVCARSLTGGHCVWHGGATLVILDQGQWKLVGVGTYGPGCQSPARFLDYGMYHEWVRYTSFNIGRPAITRVARNHLILRKTTSNVQRFGDCDPEETKHYMFTDGTTIQPSFPFQHDQVGVVRYNVTLKDNIDYYCVVFRVFDGVSSEGTPEISLRRSCETELPICDELYYLKIKFKDKCTYKVTAYGSRAIRNCLMNNGSCI